jgi:hypothetical protein
LKVPAIVAFFLGHIVVTAVILSRPDTVCQAAPAGRQVRAPKADVSANAVVTCFHDKLTGNFSVKTSAGEGEKVKGSNVVRRPLVHHR